MFSEHLSSLPVDVFFFFKVTPSGNSVTIKHASDGFVWPGFYPPPFGHWLSPLRHRDLAALPGGDTYPFSLYPIALVDALSSASLFLTCWLPQTKWIMKDMWLGGEVAVLYLFKRPLGAAQGLWGNVFSSSADEYGSGSTCVVQSMIVPYGYTVV